MRLCIILLFALPLDLWAQTSDEAQVIDSLRVSEILYSVLDTLTIRLDSNAFQKPYADFPAQARRIPLRPAIEGGFTFQPASAYFKGALDAIADLKKSQFSLKVYGLETIITLVDGTSWYEFPVRKWIMQEKYHVALEQVAGDVVNPWVIAYASGYNQISRGVIDRYFGCDVQQTVSHLVPVMIERAGTNHRNWQVPR
jgi:hypothetical protein